MVPYGVLESGLRIYLEYFIFQCSPFEVCYSYSDTLVVFVERRCDATSANSDCMFQIR